MTFCDPVQCLCIFSVNPQGPQTSEVHRQYVFTRVNTATQLINRGANGGLARSDMHVLQETSCKINIVGINDHELTGLTIATTFVVLQTNQGPIVGHVSTLRSMNIARLLVGNSTLSPLKGIIYPSPSTPD